MVEETREERVGEEAGPLERTADVPRGGQESPEIHGRGKESARWNSQAGKREQRFSGENRNPLSVSG